MQLCFSKFCAMKASVFFDYWWKTKAFWKMKRSNKFFIEIHNEFCFIAVNMANMALTWFNSPLLSCKTPRATANVWIQRCCGTYSKTIFSLLTASTGSQCQWTGSHLLPTHRAGPYSSAYLSQINAHWKCKPSQQAHGSSFPSHCTYTGQDPISRGSVIRGVQLLPKSSEEFFYHHLSASLMN